MRAKNIGIFDSGFGGLEILREITKKLPEYSYLYLGDNARAPYGNRSQKAIYNLTQKAVKLLFDKNCHLIILACNTVSSEALRKIQQNYLPKYYPDKKVLGVVIPACQQAIIVTKNNKIGVLATKNTVSSKAFERELKKLNPKIKAFQKSCPLLVPIIESGEKEPSQTKIILKKYIQPLLKKDIDTLILGCTHYGLLENKIKEIVGKKINVVSEGKIVAEKLKVYLKNHPEIEKTLKKNHKIKFLTTGSSEKFKILGSRFFGQPVSPEKCTY